MVKTKRYFDSAAPTASAAGCEEASKTGVSKKRTFPVRQQRRVEFNQDDPAAPGDAPVSDEKIRKYTYTHASDYKNVKTGFAQQRLRRRHVDYEQSARLAARSELLLSEDAGWLEADDGERTCDISQRQIAQSVDIMSATKYFDLKLPKFGPYRVDYSRQGRHLLLAGRMGHVASVDWLTKQLGCEMSVAETVRDVQWLHVETMFAVAQKKWTFVYDAKGVELHCLKNLHQARTLDFLPYHFLLVAATATSYLHWLDVSVGQIVRSVPTKEGPLDVMCQNPQNAVMHTGSASGTVSLWSPNVPQPLVKMLCHPCAVRGVAVDHSGTYMATTGLDQKLRIWDLRQFKELRAVRLPLGLGRVAFSQRRLVGAAVGTRVQVFKELCSKGQTVGEPSTAYVAHNCHKTVTDVRFCPFEDVLGIGHRGGFTSILVPGAGEPNVDALEANPFQSTAQRREFEVKALLDKVQPEMIGLDTAAIAQVDTQTLSDKLDERIKILYLKPEKVDFTPRHRMKGKSSSAKRVKRKKIVQEEARIEDSKKRAAVEVEFGIRKAKKETEGDAAAGPKSVLDRFRKQP